MVGTNACERSTLYRCNDARCPGLSTCGMEPEQKVQWLNTVQRLRCDWPTKKGSNAEQKLLGMFHMKDEEHMAEHGVTEKHTRLSDLNWTLGSRAVCVKCWTAAAGLRTHPDMSNYKKIFQDATTSYYNGTTVVEKRKRKPDGTEQSKPDRDIKMQGAVAWLTTYVNDDHGVGEYAAQYKTTDEHAHLQGESAQGLFEKYKEWMEEP